MKIAIASEHAGYELKEKLVEYLRAKGIEIEDLGVQSDEAIDYPFIAAGLWQAHQRARRIRRGCHPRFACCEKLLRKGHHCIASGCNYYSQRQRREKIL